eukprot:gene23863-25445_t
MSVMHPMRLIMSVSARHPSSPMFRALRSALAMAVALLGALAAEADDLQQQKSWSGLIVKPPQNAMMPLEIGGDWNVRTTPGTKNLMAPNQLDFSTDCNKSQIYGMYGQDLLKDSSLS